MTALSKKLILNVIKKQPLYVCFNLKQKLYNYDQICGHTWIYSDPTPQNEIYYIEIVVFFQTTKNDSFNCIFSHIIKVHDAGHRKMFCKHRGNQELSETKPK